MAYQAGTSNSELARTGLAAYENHRIRVFLANVGATGFDKNSTVANWETVKLTPGQNGYDEVTFVVPAGAYDATNEWYQMGGASGAAVDIVFTGSGAGFSWDRVVFVVGVPDGGGGFVEETNIAFLGIETPQVVLAPGTSRTYPFAIIKND